MNSVMRDDRRTHKRVKKSIFFKIIPDRHKEHRSINMSSGGLLIESSKFYGLNQRLFLELMIPNKEHIHCECNVRWIYPRRRDTRN